MSIKKIAIVGGGTAGWLAANHLGKALVNNPDISITLIESPDIPPIGVGEGTVPMIRKTLASFGISETDFIQQCEVTFKQSIKFVNWRAKEKNQAAHAFHHLFAFPSPFGDDLTAAWCQQGGKAYADFVSSQHKVCQQGKAPKFITTPEYQGEQGYAYHLNAAKFAQLLAKNAQEKFSVAYLSANVNQVELTDDGAIAALNTDQAGRQAFDFYIDCSGFASVLMAKALKVPFVDKSHQLLVNTALTVQVPTAADDAIPPYTIATAHQAGWIWDIALTNRRGVGFVYSNNHMSDAEATAKLDHYLGDKAVGLTYRKLPMKVGHGEKFWQKNCISLGLAQGFLEPLEATSILLTDFAAGYLAKRFPHSKSELSLLAQRFNQVMTYAWQRVIDFIKLHYCLSDRRDSKFWLDNQNLETIPESLQQKLTLWQNFVPEKEDFFTKFEVFDLDNYLYVLYGMNYHTKVAPLSEAALAQAKRHAEKIAAVADNLSEQLPEHRALLDKIKRYGLPSI